MALRLNKIIHIHSFLNGKIHHSFGNSFSLYPNAEHLKTFLSPKTNGPIYQITKFLSLEIKTTEVTVATGEWNLFKIWLRTQALWLLRSHRITQMLVRCYFSCRSGTLINCILSSYQWHEVSVTGTKLRFVFSKPVWQISEMFRLLQHLLFFLLRCVLS